MGCMENSSNNKIKKRFKILCITLLVVCLGSIANSILEGWFGEGAPGHVNIYEFVLTGGARVLRVVLTLMVFGMLCYYVHLLVLFVKMIRILMRTEPFENRVIRYSHRIGIGFVCLSVIATVWGLLRDILVIRIIGIEDKISRFSIIDWEDLVIGMIVLVMTSILKQAILIKEENDLTV